jgi:FdhD protein
MTDRTPLPASPDNAPDGELEGKPVFAPYDDKPAGALLRRGRSAAEGVVVLSSRISIELVQKAGMMGAAIIVGVSAPTALAVRTAEATGLTLVGIARDDGFEVFTHPERITRYW